MERRRALVVAGTLAATLAMAGTAMAVNLGLLGADSDPVGDLTVSDVQPARTEDTGPPTTRVIVQDIPVPAGGGSGAAASTPGPAPGTTSSDDDSGDDRFDDHGGDRDDDEHEDDEHEDHEDDD